MVWPDRNDRAAVPHGRARWASADRHLQDVAHVCLQHWYGLADEALEDALYDSQALRDFVGIDLSRESAPDATTLLKFRRLLLDNDLTKALFDEINAHLAEQGLLMRSGTIVDATIIATPSSTKNEGNTRDPKMHQIKKGNAWHFDMKAHIGVDASRAWYIRGKRLVQGRLERRELAVELYPLVLRHNIAGRPEPLLDRVARQARALCDLAEGEFVAQPHAPDLANHVHGDHLESPAEIFSGPVKHPGQFWIGTLRFCWSRLRRHSQPGISAGTMSVCEAARPDQIKAGCRSDHIGGGGGQLQRVGRQAAR